MQDTIETKIPFSKKQIDHLYKMTNQVQLSCVPSSSQALIDSAFTNFLNLGDLGDLKSILLGYFPTQKGYEYFDPPTKKVFVIIDVTFLGHQSYFTQTSL